MTFTARVFLIVFSVLAQSAEVLSHQGKQIAPGLFQLTGTHLYPGQTEHPLAELPDAAPPYFTPDGAVEIYGSARYFIRYESYFEFQKAGRYEIVPLDLRYPSGYPMLNTYGHPWDLLKFFVKTSRGGFEMLIGGSMSPTKGRPGGVWPEDNINRRLFFFLKKEDKWIRADKPIVGQIDSGWIGHSYGGNLFQDGQRHPNVFDFQAPEPVYIFYERVSESNEKIGPFKTELFARRLINVEKVDPQEIKIMDVGNPPYPATRRTIGGYLMEGPRPFKAKIGSHVFYIVGFSSGDFPTDGYTINYAWSKSITGPYRPKLNASATDLEDLGADIKRKYNLSWVGRPTFYRTPSGEYEVLFHGVMKSILPDNDYKHWPDKYQLWQFYRCLFKAKVKVGVSSRGIPVLKLAPDGR